MRERISDSLNHIKNVHATPSRMVDKSIYVLGVMNLPERPGECCSSSIGKMIGAAVLGNFHENKWGVGKLADAIIHEAIHNVIYKLELESGLHTDYDAALQASLTSPWSGQTLPLESFVHACFVWFGLLNFWNLNALDKPEFRDLRNIAGRGFLKESLTSLLSAELRSYTKPAVLLALKEIWDRVTPECVA
jgi:HEXXH motif-containing protein